MAKKLGNLKLLDEENRLCGIGHKTPLKQSLNPRNAKVCVTPHIDTAPLRLTQATKS
jgi:hypothetical protein